MSEGWRHLLHCTCLCCHDTLPPPSTPARRHFWKKYEAKPHFLSEMTNIKDNSATARWGKQVQGEKAVSGGAGRTPCRNKSAYREIRMEIKKKKKQRGGREGKEKKINIVKLWKRLSLSSNKMKTTKQTDEVGGRRFMKGCAHFSSRPLEVESPF